MNPIDAAIDIVKTLRNSGYTAYFAGGWVRDFLLKIPSSDIDIATDALPEEIVELFPKHVLVGAKFGVVLVLHNDHQFEIATFRKDIAYVNGRTPSEISLKSTPEEDSMRRDFTMNGLFYDPLTQEIHDFVGGKSDLEKGLIKTIGNPYERFQEDRLRMMRAIRFAHRFGFEIDKETRDAILQLSSQLLPAVSMERIWGEFCKMREGPEFQIALLDMKRLGLLDTLFPLLKNSSVDAIRDRLQHVESKKIPTILCLALLFDTSDEPFVKELHYFLKASKDEGQWLSTFIHCRTLFSKELSTISLYDLVHVYANQLSQQCLEALHPDDSTWSNFHKTMREKLRFYIESVQKKQPLVRAKDLQELGIPPGKLMGKLLQEAERIAIDHNFRDKETVIQELSKLPIWKESQ